ncbi:hypothetical protein BJV82DRAFT_718242 [Fennellomyces sp. T-0311]|nr:hypothetical protein BJV82DRAFT_718242 [Fennellomyces sp. T-0311]
MFDNASSRSTDQPKLHGDALIDWQQIITLTKNALDQRDYDAVIDQSSAAIDDLQQKLVQLFKMRVVAWGRKLKFAEELKDAMAIIQYAPHDPVGYFRVGHRYIDQGLQAKAFEVFSSGLRNVPRTNHLYEMLRIDQHRSLVSRCKRIDFIANVPFDIMAIIVDHIPQETLAECLEVSSIWRQKLLAYPGCWRNVRIEKFKPTVGPSVYRALPNICHHIREFSLPHAPQVTKCLELMRTKNFASLQSFHTQEPLFNVPQDNYALFYMCLPNIAVSLKSLDIHTHKNQTLLLSQVLAICRNLTSIRFRDWAYPKAFTGLRLPFNTSLQKVVLESQDDNLRSSDLVDLFKCSPEIRYLALTNCHNDMYTLVGEHCPNIKELKITNYAHPLGYFKAESNDGIGLRTLRADRPPSRFTLASLIDRHLNTLRNLRISFPDTDMTATNWGSLSSFSLPNLAHLSLEEVPEAVTNELPSLFAQCSNLESIYLHIVYGDIPEDAFTAAAKLKQLTALVLHEASFTEQSMLRFLREVQCQQDGRPGLKELELCDCNDTAAVLIACTTIQSLVSLTIDPYTDLEVDDKRSFVEGLAELPRLQKLWLQSVDFFDYNLLRIGESKSLKQVELYNIHGLTEEQIRSAFPSHITLLLD